MDFVVEQNPLNQRAKSLVNVKGFTKVVRRRHQDKVIEKLSRKDHPFQKKGSTKW
jgi:hypothetical protein